MKLLYRCYDENLKDFLLQKGQRYELKALDIKTQCPFYAFVNNDYLEKLIKIWESQSPKNR